MDVRGKGVVVTGAGHGIGRAIASRLAAEGARVVVNDLDADAARAVAAEIGGTAAPGDAASEAGVTALVETAREQLGAIDVYFANAGVDVGRGLDTPEEAWGAALEVNVMAHVRAARLLVPAWLEAGGGRFVVTASAAGLLTMLGGAPYSVSKHAAVAFAEWMSLTYGSRGIAVSCLCPMGVNTAMLTSGADSDDETARRGARAVTEAGGVLEPDAVADIVVQALGEEPFLILPHPEVREFYRRKGADHDRWLAGMRRYQDTLG